jgi:energy-coupling factor transporter ATP-binding protein EcfA2
MMLARISVQGFKSLQNVQDLDLGQVNVFVGANGSGKSNLLEAVGLLGASTDGRIDDQALSRRGVRLGVPLLYQSSFKGTRTCEKVIISATQKSEQGIAEYKIGIISIANVQHQPWPFMSTYTLDDQELTPESVKSDFPSLHGELPLTPQKTLPYPKFLTQPPFEGFLAALSDYAIFAPRTPILRGLEPDVTQRLPVGLQGGGLAKAVADLLDARAGTFGALDLDELLQLLDWVDEIAVGSPSHKAVPPYVPMTRNVILFTDRWMEEERNQLSAYDASEGALYVLFALVLALHPRSPLLFAIENLDQAMHPRLARATIRLFCRQILASSPPRQVLLTTHNPLVLDGLDLRDERIRLFTVERDAQGATRVDRVQVSDEIVQSVADGLPLSTLWVMGRLGGAPDIF